MHVLPNSLLFGWRSESRKTRRNKADVLENIPVTKAPTEGLNKDQKASGRYILLNGRLIYALTDNIPAAIKLSNTTYTPVVMDNNNNNPPAFILPGDTEDRIQQQIERNQARVNH